MLRKKAIAINYNQNSEVPKIIAKSKNEIAEQIVKIAKEEDIPVYEDKLLVELLYLLEVGYQVPEPLYEVVAEVLAFVYLANEEYKNYIGEEVNK